jgi:hypothetical protein
MNDPNVTHETKNDSADVLFEHDWRRDEKNESTKKEVLKNERQRNRNQGLFAGAITYLYRLVITVAS